MRKYIVSADKEWSFCEDGIDRLHWFLDESFELQRVSPDKLTPEKRLLYSKDIDSNYKQWHKDNQNTVYIGGLDLMLPVFYLKWLYADLLK